MLNQLLNFESELIFFSENFTLKQNYFSYTDYSTFMYLSDYTNYNFLHISKDNSLYNKSLITFIDQTEDMAFFHNLENVQTIYHYSIPNTKLSYPEPYIASASFMHNDLWFVHILIYQYWLWFVFVFIIVFFFIGFITTVRWCNMRVRPRRETRGVSRSKCGDLLTATVPVSWAASIIISESTDAIDYYDGFGTTELVIGIRAYQWGWEYYYPKDLDLNYNLKHNYSSFIGNSLKYNTTTDTNTHTNNFWKFYQNKGTDAVVTPAHLLLLPLDNYKILNFLNFNDIGANPLSESNAFKKIRSSSKTFTSNLVYNPTNYSGKYKSLTSVYVNDNFFADSYLYGFKRQHNFLSSKSISNSNATFFNLNSVDKLLKFNWQTQSNLFTTFNGLTFFNFFKKISNNSLSFNLVKLNTLFEKIFPNPSYSYWNKIHSYPSLLETINDDSDKKKLHYPIYKIFNLYNKKINMNNYGTLNQLGSNSDITVSANLPLNHVFNNNQITYKTLNVFSSNQSVPVANRSVRKFSDTLPNVSHFNLNSNINTVNDYFNTLSSSTANSNLFFHNLANTKWIDPSLVNKLASNRIYFDSPFAPIVSNNPLVSSLNYDDCRNTFVEDTPTVLQSKDEFMPTFVPSIYWNMYWGNSSVDWRFSNNLIYNNVHSNFYLPLFSFYYDYDFRNWQSLELLEDSFWESINSVYLYEEYATLANDFSQYEYLDKYDNFYNTDHKLLKFKDSIINKPFFKNINSLGSFYSNAFYLDDYVSPAELLSTSKFFIFPIINSLNTLDDSYESMKYLNYLYNINHKIFINSSLNYFQPYSYIFVFDMFRSDYEGFTWFLDNSNKWSLGGVDYLLNYCKFDWKLDLWNTDLFNQSDTLLNENKIYWESATDLDLKNDRPNLENTLRFDNYLNLRNSVRSSIVTYNAIQKVFRSRFDESRSNVKLVDFANFHIKQPYISSPRVQYEKLLGKNKESFFKVNLYKSNFSNFFNNFYDVSTSLNFFFFDFPFLMALKSDATRYLWFDWYAKWGFYEVQPSSASRYAIYGMPYFNKSFDFAGHAGEAVSETENYLLRLSRARKNYLPNWVYTPYFYAKTSSWYKNNVIFEIFHQSENSVTSAQNVLDLMGWYWNDTYFINFHNYLFLPSNSNMNSYVKSSWRPSSSIQSYYFTVTALIDTLTKREYLYRQLLSSNNKIINLPFYLTNNPTNPLVAEIKSAFLLIDPIIYNNEYSRDIYYSSLTFFNFNILKSLLKNSSETLSINWLTDYLFFYFFSEDYDTKLGNNSDLFKSQYRPMRKGISNMLRLHATGAMAMPTEIRLQILASSKDIIHSWAIPSAGIKIDCVPGYSSHRVMIFLVSGIFWGQCMEICGRYHHWMPIVVYFMKRDLFFLWCTHFVFLSGANNMWDINDRQYTDYTRLVSFAKDSWVSEASI